MSLRIAMIKVLPGTETLEKVNIASLRQERHVDVMRQTLERHREIQDACARAERALMLYYVRRAKGEIKLEVLAAA